AMDACAIRKLDAAPERYGISLYGGIGFELRSSQKHDGIAPNHGVGLQMEVAPENDRVTIDLTIDGEFASKHDSVTTNSSAHQRGAAKYYEIVYCFVGLDFDILSKDNLVPFSRLGPMTPPLGRGGRFLRGSIRVFRRRFVRLSLELRRIDHSCRG